MFRFQQNIAHHSKNQKNSTRIKKKAINEGKTEMRQILELFNKKFKAAIINMFQGEITNARLKQIKKQKVSANEKKKNLGEEIENTKKDQMEVLELRNIITKNKNKN